MAKLKGDDIEVMTVAELIMELQALPNQDAVVVLQRDPEGNGYSPLRGADGDGVVYVASDNTAYSKQDQSDGYGAGGIPCCVLHPLW